MDSDRRQLSAMMQRIFACVGDGTLADDTAARLLDVESLAVFSSSDLLPPIQLRRAILSFEVLYPVDRPDAFAPTPQTEIRLRNACEALAWSLDLGYGIYVGPVGIYLDLSGKPVHGEGEAVEEEERDGVVDEEELEF